MRIIVIAAVLAAMSAAPRADATDGRVDVGVLGLAGRTGAFDAWQGGAGVRLSLRFGEWVGGDAEASLSASPDRTTAAPIDAHAGLRIGPRLGRTGVYAAFRAGVRRFGKEETPCILIHPPPLACRLAAGETTLSLQVAAGFERPAGDRFVLRVEAGDQLVRYPGPVIVEDEVSEDASWSHNFRAALLVGLRF